MISSFDTLMSPEVSNLVDMTDRVRILGDAPMVAGKCDPERMMNHISFITVGVLADFWLAGTSSGNLVAAKVMRGEYEQNVRCSSASVLHVASMSLKRVHQVVLREARISARFAHPNVLPTLGIALTMDSLAIISPWMRNGNIFEYLNRNPSADRLRLVNSSVGVSPNRYIDMCHCLVL